jgi:hypothetical protein
VKTDRSLLEAALVGYQAQLTSIQQHMQEIRKQLGTKTGGSQAGAAAEPGARTKRRLSGAARKRIALAQKKRWAEYNKKKAAGQ